MPCTRGAGELATDTGSLDAGRGAAISPRHEWIAGTRTTSSLPSGAVVKVNGAPPRNAIDADVENGFALAFEYNREGRIVRNADGSPALIEVWGAVEVTS
jgi:hypothetical protein